MTLRAILLDAADRAAILEQQLSDTQARLDGALTRLDAALLRVAELEQQILVDPAPTADRQANAATRRTLAYLRGLSGKTLAGQHVGGYSYTDLTYLTGIAGGKVPAVMGVDYDTRGSNITPGYATANTRMKAHWDAGGLVTISIHALNPSNNTKYDVTPTRIDAAAIITPGSSLYSAWRSQLDRYAVGLADLQAKGVTVLWRPFHEVNSTSFWWTYSYNRAQNGSFTTEQFKTFWRQTFDYLTNAKGLHNLLWVFAPSLHDGAGKGAAAWYPGDAYVDVVGFSNYRGAAFSAADRALVDRFHAAIPAKPFAMCEVGRPAGVTSYDATHERNLYRDVLPYVVYEMRWVRPHGFKDNPNPGAFLTDPRVITRDEVDYRRSNT